MTHTDNVCLTPDGTAVRILDQSRLPNETIYLELSRAEDLYEAIHSLRVRGAPAIGIFAAYAMYVLACQSKAELYFDFIQDCEAIHRYLNASRPTAVNLKHMLDRMLAVAEAMPCMDVDSIRASMKKTALAIHQEDMDMCSAIARHGLSLVKDGDEVNL